jgi:hypothetical protein
MHVGDDHIDLAQVVLVVVVFHHSGDSSAAFSDPECFRSV